MTQQSKLQALDFATLETVVGGTSYYYSNNNGHIETNMPPEMQQSFGISPDGGMALPSLPAMPSLPAFGGGGGGFDFSQFGF